MLLRAALIAFTLSLGLLGAAPAAVQAEEYQVTITGDPQPFAGTGSLRDAIQQANEHAGPDTIALPPGTYAIEIPGGGEQENQTGDFDITDSVSIIGVGSVVIDAGGLERVFDVPIEDLNVMIQGLTIQNGLSTSHGGGMRTLSSLQLRDVTFLNNHAMADFGGGLVIQGGKPILTNVTFTGNESNLNGGGISQFVFTDPLEITGGVFTNNTSGNGAGLNVPGNGTLKNLVVRDNHASFSGGGIGTGGGQNTTVVIEDSVIDGNTAGNRSGGIEGGSTNITINRTAIVNNTAGVRGGGMTVFGTTIATNVTISGNSAGDNGGGVYNGDTFGGRTELRYSTIANNTADSDNDADGDGGGVYNAPVSGSPAVTGFVLHNSILAYNESPNGNPDCFGSQVRLDDGNIVSQTSPGCTFLGAGGGDMLDTDPLLGPLANNGGATFTHALLTGSPARDEGTDCPPPDTDQRNFPRPEGEDCDMGAFEGPAPLIWGDNNCSGIVAPEDALPQLIAGAGLTPDPPDNCLAIGDDVEVPEVDTTWGDVDCNGAFSPNDILRILEYAADVVKNIVGVCPAVGDALIVVR